MLPTKLAFVDIETTGTSPTRDRIIEIGIIRVEDGKIVSTYKTLIDPGFHIPQEIINLTGITPKDLESAPNFLAVKEEILEQLQGCIFVAHNVRFDYSFIKNELKRYRAPFTPKQICTVKLSRILYPSFHKHDLSTIIERFNFQCQSRHRAFDDAYVLWDFYQLIQKNFPADLVEKAINIISKKPSIPNNLSPETLKNLPQSPGVYIFYGTNDSVLYIGKSINIRDRVLSHFAADHKSSKEMKLAQQVTHIETIKTAGELGALLLESSLIKKMQPLYNRALRYSQQLNVLLESQDSNGYKIVEQSVLSAVDITELPKVIGIFRSLKSAKQFLIKAAREHQLCEKLLGLESLKGSCFGYRLGRCKGACIEKEIRQKYNLRFLEAFVNLRVKPWPFEGPIIISEKNPLEEINDNFLIDKWCYIGTVKSDNLIPGISVQPYFDVDSYKILNRYIRSSKNTASVRLLTQEEVSFLGLPQGSR